MNLSTNELKNEINENLETLATGHAAAFLDILDDIELNDTCTDDDINEYVQDKYENVFFEGQLEHATVQDFVSEKEYEIYSLILNCKSQ